MLDVYADPIVHAEMIADPIRTDSYRSAILEQSQLIKGKVVMDVGAGTGILSIFCVQAGAAKVYAIEASEAYILAEAVVKENNMHDKIHIIHNKVEDVELTEKVDVIVSEVMGTFLLAENVYPSVLVARDRFLKPDGIMIPSKASMYLAPFSDTEYMNKILSFWDTVPQKYGVSMSHVKPLAQRFFTKDARLIYKPSKSVIAQRNEITQIDFQTVTVDDVVNVKSCFDFTCSRTETVHGFLGWFDVKLSDNRILSTSPDEPETHWKHCVLYVDKPFTVNNGSKISGNLSLQVSPENERLLDVTLNYKVENQDPESKSYVIDVNTIYTYSYYIDKQFG